ncbi:thioredoxin f [Nannochloropsis gaditana CCMP526]|uniref:Thioredoxin f n=1 Tax=Nannochloropsis gaditana TaxID=72520 RepID=W7U649_9STRA|nr:thioredoxin f [Nannochloropsis gaditana CCMP526]EKU23086.1 thioredoxin f [Nannochloropsis gaditana CCMP526]EWM28306.1 thioredoxin f [Nannochloropsis gaditana]|eukprot:XP_005852743.1 thioredoxin f [Nannochloropsis gaditana CCMP526]
MTRTLLYFFLLGAVLLSASDAFVAPPVHSSRASRVQLVRQQAVVEASSPDDFDKLVTGAGEKLLIVDYSTTWCGPCKMMAPKFDEMSSRFDAVFVKVIGDSTPEAGQLLKREGVRSVPAFHFWKNGKRVDSISGADPERLEDVISQNI